MNFKNCPRCFSNLNSINTCESCNGTLTSLAIMNTICPVGFLEKCMSEVKRNGQDSKLKCPDCKKTMTVVSLPDCETKLDLDFCLGCQNLWFDANELKQIPKKSALAKAHAESQRLQKHRSSDQSNKPEQIDDSMDIAIVGLLLMD